MDEERRQRVANQLAQSPYRLVDHLGRGSVADVFLVEHRIVGKRFALKLIHAHLVSHAGYVERLIREARAIARLESEHIVRIIDLSETDDGLPFLVLERLKGRSLASELLRRRTIPWEQCRPWVSQMLEGLAVAHEHGIVHRDLTPSNLFLQELPTGQTRLKIMDFGLAGITPGAEVSAPLLAGVATSTGALIGSPAYASPEAFRGEALDPRADVYSAGLIVYETLTGIGPMDITQDILPTPTSTPHLAEILSRATHRDRTVRYATAQEFLQAITTVDRRSPEPNHERSRQDE